MEPTRRLTLQGLGFEHGLSGADAPVLPDPDERAVYQTARGQGYAVSGRDVRPDTFSEYARAVLAWSPFEPAPRPRPSVAAGTGEPSVELHDRGWSDGAAGREPTEVDGVYMDGWHAGRASDDANRPPRVVNLTTAGGQPHHPEWSE